jgi:LPXTG-motif cell wall-anchored protein
MKPVSPAVSNVSFEIIIAVVVGDPVAGGSTEFSSTGLQPSSPWELVVHSTPRVLASGTSGAAGTILGNAVIPPGLEAGWHSVTLSGRNYLGYQASSTTWFEINAAGELIGASGIDPNLARMAEQKKLAQTGQATREIALLAFALMTLGFVLTRRRRTQTS